MIKLSWFQLLFFVLVWHYSAHATCVNRTPGVTTVTINTVTDTFKDEVAREFADPFLVQKITIDADVFVQQNEMLYLVGFKEGDIIDGSALNKALFYLIKKDVFEQIVLSVKKGLTGSEVAFRLSAFWTLETVRVSGIWFGKDVYKQQYVMDQGEPFDINKHKGSVARIREIIEAEGFLDPHIHDELTYDKKTKGVRVDLTIDKGNQFRVSTIDLKVRADRVVDSNEQESVRSEALALLNKRMAGKHYSKNLMNKETTNLKQMLTRRGFLHADITLHETIDYTKKQVKVLFSIDLHVKKEFVFFGNSFFSDHQLFDTVMAFGRSTWMVPPAILAQEIETAYQNNGFWHVSVESKEEQGRIFFVIKEGSRASIKEVVLKNVIQFSPHILINNCMAGLLALKYFDAQQLKKSIGDLVAFYQDEGFFDAAVVDQERTELDDATGYRIVLTVSEGDRRYIRSVKFDQLAELCIECPRVADIEAQKKVPCTRSLIDKQRKWIEARLKEQGYKTPKAKAELVPDGHMIDLIWHIDVSCANEVCGKTVLVSTRTVPFEVVAREMEYNLGDPLKKEKLKESLANVKGLDIFDSANIYSDQNRELGCERAIMLKMYPSDRFEARMHVGIGLQQMRWPVALDGLTYKLGGSFIVKNPTNCGDQIRLDVDATRIRHDIAARYIRPWIFGLPVRASFDVYSNKFEQQGFFYDRENWYQVFQQGFLTNLSGSKGIFDYTANIGLEWMKMNIRKEYCCIADRISHAYNIDSRLLDKNIPYWFLEPTIMLDYLDQKLNPTRGSFTLFSCKALVPMSEPGGLNPYIFKCSFEQSFYVPLDPVVLAMRLRAGYIFGQDIKNILLNERFYLGGAHSIRSYYTDGTPPLGEFTDDYGCKHFVPQGGKGMVNASIEARVPIYAGLQGVLFQDFGALSHTNFTDIKPRGILAGTGVGLLYNTPIGPLRFDIGWKWSCPKPFDQSYAWFLSLGQVF